MTQCCWAVKEMKLLFELGQRLFVRSWCFTLKHQWSESVCTQSGTSRLQVPLAFSCTECCFLLDWRGHKRSRQALWSSPKLVPGGGVATLGDVLDQMGRSLRGLSNSQIASVHRCRLMAVGAGSVTGERRRKQRTGVLHPSTESSFCTRQKPKLFGEHHFASVVECFLVSFYHQ